MAVTLVALDRPRTPRRLGAMIAAAATLPAIYELFRMCYYGNLLPNTAYTKEATTANWAQGWEYLKDFNRPYWAWVPAVILVVAVGATWGRVPGMRRRLVLATPTVAGLSVSTDDISIARQALDCPAIQRMLERARAPLTLDRMVHNVVESFTEFGTRIDPDPAKELARCRQVRS